MPYRTSPVVPIVRCTIRTPRRAAVDRAARCAGLLLLLAAARFTPNPFAVKNTLAAGGVGMPDGC